MRGASEIRSTSIAIASTAVSMRSMRPSSIIRAGCAAREPLTHRNRAPSPMPTNADADTIITIITCANARTSPSMLDLRTKVCPTYGAEPNEVPQPPRRVRSLGPQRRVRIRTRRPTSGRRARHHGDEHQHGGDRYVHDGIAHRLAEQQRLEPATRGEGNQRPHHDASHCQPHSLTHDETDQLPARRAQCGPNRQLVQACRDVVPNHAVEAHADDDQCEYAERD